MHWQIIPTPLHPLSPPVRQEGCKRIQLGGILSLSWVSAASPYLSLERMSVTEREGLVETTVLFFLFPEDPVKSSRKLYSWAIHRVHYLPFVMIKSRLSVHGSSGLRFQWAELNCAFLGSPETPNFEVGTCFAALVLWGAKEKLLISSAIRFLPCIGKNSNSQLFKYRSLIQNSLSCL